ncbi:hypothetical protein FA15DRAFT_409038 [Coprinopsis marcescibilis]|uniref:Uncharacterized protein n=1 Tax=Coprinopsis marcescibilis TaxID=230819 RepID=A0A5C3KWC3_COPMA|nr:hypothetical protein FA15DRAFT_409038 [Coprinopsis marcescibilis]
MQQKSIKQWAGLAAGEVHQLSVDMAPTPESVMDGSFQRALAHSDQKDIVIYVPRRPEYSGEPTISLELSVDGKPGPYIRDVAKGTVVVDGARDRVFYDMGWKQTWVMVDWPGTTNSRTSFCCYDEDGRPVTRADVAAYVSISVCQFIVAARKGKLQWGPQCINKFTKQWDLKEVDYRDVRLMALNYYRNTWVPVLAFDCQ